MSTRHERGPRPAEIADAIEAEIRSGHRAPGTALGSRSALSEQYGVGESTIYSAIGTLKDRGMVIGQQGRGVYVADPSTWRIIITDTPDPDPPADP